ncbi:lytic transglycosylase domain-containing protein [Kineosporia succinea]|uniref:Soluble lytic murein transglycosylase-like protein n=1 Tax=Kineosporia succinea TaxID=84632 RepID=A0ABT9P788_9ACTN|nr:lytic transglycosylase domain-containing protein [Kineosporia succinea]MDP9828269.1 soluble lytic murein transglycosylase-like protein [Kineosporia succinea]
MTDPTAALLGVPGSPRRRPGSGPKPLSDSGMPLLVVHHEPPHVLARPPARPRRRRPGPGVQLLLRRTRLSALLGLTHDENPPPEQPPPLVLLGRPGTTPDAIPHLTTASTAPNPSPAALRTAGLRVLLEALVSADPDETGLARRRALAAGQPPADTSGSPTLAYRVKAGDDLETVARTAGCAPAAVLAANHMRPGAALKTGQLIRLPALATSSADPARKPPVADTTRALAARRRRTRRGEVIPAGDLPHRSYPPAVTKAAETNREALKHADVPDRPTARGIVRATAVHFGVDPALALAVASMESGFDQRLVSPANAIGVMQLLPSAGAWAGELLGRPLDLLDTKDNITAGTVLLLALGRHADEQTALAGYYQGLASVRRHGTFPDTRRYVATVRTLKLRFR